MTAFELIIIYLAAGAPYAVYAFFDQTVEKNLRHLAVVLLKYAVWPFFAFRLLIRELSKRLENDPTEGHSVSPIILETEGLRQDISCSIVFKNNLQRRQLFDEFERFAGIAAAIDNASRIRRPSTPAVLETINHRYQDLAAQCIFRRNRSRLIEHRKRAFDGFVTELNKASTNGGPFTIEELVERARRLAPSADS